MHIYGKNVASWNKTDDSALREVNAAKSVNLDAMQISAPIEILPIHDRTEWADANKASHELFYRGRSDVVRVLC